LLPFTVTIPQGDRDPNLSAKLKTEAEGILGWLVEGMLLYHSEGLIPPAAVKLATDEYREESNPLREFVSEDGIGVAQLDSEARTPAGELRKAYEAWAKENRRTRVKQGKQWSDGLKALGCHEERTAGERCWGGIRLLTGMPV
jgi:putative DNA primase/helicase